MSTVNAASSAPAPEESDVLKLQWEIELLKRAIGRIKTYHILDGTLPNTLSPYATQIAVVCGLLTNFLLPLLEPAKEPLHVFVS